MWSGAAVNDSALIQPRRSLTDECEGLDGKKAVG